MRTETNRITLTNKMVDELSSLPAQSRARRYWDAKIPALYLSFSRAGTASFCIRYTKADGKDGDFTIARANLVTVEMARSAAREKLAALALHCIDPVDERRAVKAEAKTQGDTTFGAVAEAYITSREQGRSKPLQETYFLRKYVIPEIGEQQVDSIKRQDLKSLIEGIQAGVAARDRNKNSRGKHTAKHSLQALKSVFRFANDSELTDRNPADFHPNFQIRIVKRHDRLDEGRFKSVWEDATRSYLLRPRFKTPIALMLYMVTLQRPIDICRALKRDFNLERRTWRIVDETKTEVEYFIPLSDLAIALVRLAMSWNDSKWLFPKSGGRGDHMPSTHVTNFWTHMRSRLVKNGDWDERDIELYDCRRFGRTELEKSLNVSKAIAERVINHSEPAGMDTRYDVHNYSGDVRRAQTAWGQHVEKLTGIGASDLARKLGAAVVKPLKRRAPHLRKS